MKRSKYEKGEYVPPRPPGGRVTLPRVVIGSTILLVLFVAGMQLWNSSRGGSTAAASNPPSPVEETVFTPDGKPISNEPLTVAGVQVPEPAVNLGLQPLDTGVSHEFKLRNTSAVPVVLGKANIEVLQGCCPSDPVLTATKIEPGAEVPLLFSLPMGMHKGMDGEHLFRLTVPVRNASGDAGTLEVYVKADFRAGAGSGNHAGHAS